MEKADYRKIAAHYDQSRSLSARNVALWTDLIARHSGLSSGQQLLDLGCGTGRFALPLAERLGLRVTGADLSAEMLAQAKPKCATGAVRWVRADAGAPGLAGGAFDAVFMSHLLHHVGDPLAVLDGCHRVLRPGGAVLIRYGAIDQIRNDVEHTLFPGAVRIDEQRTPSVPTVEEWLAAAGFGQIASVAAVQQTHASGAAHLEAARQRNTSVLTMISERDYQTGLSRLAEYVATHPDDPWLLTDAMTLTVGRRSVEAEDRARSPSADPGSIAVRSFAAHDQAAARQLILEGCGEHWGCIDVTLNADLDDIAASYVHGAFLCAWLGSELVGTGA